MITIQDGELALSLDLANGAEVMHLGRTESNVLAAYDWDTGDQSGVSDFGRAWLARYRGGWQTLFPNIGPAGSWEGAPVGHHGDWSRTEIELVDKSEQLVTVSAVVGNGLRHTRTIEVRDDRVFVTQEVTNESERSVPFIWGEHPAFDLEPGVRIELPGGPAVVAAKDQEFGDLVPGAAGAWPFVPGKAGQPVDLSVVPAGPAERLVFLPERRDPRAVITWPADSESPVERLTMTWDSTAFPHLYLWSQIGGPGYPYEGRARITALELCSVWPPQGLVAAIEQGRAEWLDPGQRRTSHLTLALEWRTPSS